MKLYTHRLLLPVLALLIPAVASAAVPVDTIDTPQEVIGAIKNIGDWMYTIFLALAVIFIIYAAFIYLTSGGGDGVAKAHKMLLYAAVAIAVAVGANGIIALVQAIIKT